MASDLPSALSELLRRLQDDGFSVVSDVLDETAFGDRLIELLRSGRDGGSAVRVARDRGLWSVEIKVADKWRDPHQVLLAIKGAKYATRASNHEERLRFTLEALERLSDAPTKQVAGRLEEFDREYWRRLGVRDPGGS